MSEQEKCYILDLGLWERHFTLYLFMSEVKYSIFNKGLKITYSIFKKQPRKEIYFQFNNKTKIN